MGTLGCEVAWPPPRLGDGDLRRAMDAVEGHVDAVVVAELSGDPALHAWLLEDVLGGCVRPEAPRRPPSMNARKASVASKIEAPKSTGLLAAIQSGGGGGGPAVAATAAEEEGEESGLEDDLETSMI